MENKCHNKHSDSSCHRKERTSYTYSDKNDRQNDNQFYPKHKLTS